MPKCTYMEFYVDISMTQHSDVHIAIMAASFCSGTSWSDLTEQK